MNNRNLTVCIKPYQPTRLKLLIIKFNKVISTYISKLCMSTYMHVKSSEILHIHIKYLMLKSLKNQKKKRL